MLSKHFIDIRDFCYVWLKKRDGEREAESWYQYQVMGLFAFYHIALMAIMAYLLREANVSIPFLKGDRSWLKGFFVGTLIFIPYIAFFKYLFWKAVKYPIDKDMSAKRYRTVSLKVLLVFLLGMVSFAWVMLLLLPPSEQ